MRHMLESQETAATGKRIRAASDDPVGASALMQADGLLRALEPYKRNIGNATSRVNAEEGALDSPTQLLEWAKELGVSSGQ
jgi:flagellin-like hook-associated protein FlgL